MYTDRQMVQWVHLSNIDLRSQASLGLVSTWTGVFKGFPTDIIFSISSFTIGFTDLPYFS